MSEAGESIIRGLKEAAAHANAVSMMQQALRYYANGEWDEGVMAQAVLDIMETKEE